MRNPIFFIIASYLLLTSCTDEVTFIGFSYPEGNYKALIMSYDDGTIEDIEVASLFNKNNIIGTFNLNSEYLGTTRGWPMLDGDTIFQAYIPRDSLLTVYKKHEIAAHGAYHQNFIDITDVEVLKEIETDMRNLKQLTGKALKSMAYPFGNTTEHIAKIVETTGITNARTVADTYTFKLPQNYFIWNPTCHDSKALNYLDDYLLLKKPELSLFYVWGHSWEFNDQKRWDDFVAFCEQIGNQDDIWYVGNGEYIDYLKALKKIRITKNEIINPIDNAPVWIEVATGFKMMEPGSKLNIKS